MDYIKEYKKFVNGYNFTDAIRTTISIALPPVLFSYFGQLTIGIVVALGALAVSSSDIPGPIHQRRNGMLASLIVVFIAALATGFAEPYPIILGFIIAILSFSLNMIAVYGARASAVGSAGILIMILSLTGIKLNTNQLFLNAVFLLVGGLWYTLLSLALFRFRPYKIVQQALGDSIISIADYLHTRARFYDKEVDYDTVYKQLMLLQETVQTKHGLLREMLFKSRHISKQSTTVGRTLLAIFVDSIDLFEQLSATMYDYKSMHAHFDNTHVLEHFKKIIDLLAKELEDIGIAVQSGAPSRPSEELKKELSDFHTYIDEFVAQHRSPENLESFMGLQQIMHSIDDVAARLFTLHHYTKYDRASAKNYRLAKNYDPFVSSTKIDWGMLIDDLSIKSNIFRHSLRVGLAMVAGFIASSFLNLGYGYWVLLTIFVILKPAYSLSKQRNVQRLVGTFIGALLGLIIIFLIRNNTWLFIVLVIFIILTYSFIRTKYTVGVVFMTAYVLIMFFLTDSTHFVTVFENRIVDTIIGSAIAFLATFFLVPSWEKQQLQNYMTAALEKSIAYFKKVSYSLTGSDIADLDFRLSRKDAFISLANLSGAFTRMMNEPKSKQQQAKNVQQFVVMMHMLNSHIASLSGLETVELKRFQSAYFSHAIQDILTELEDANNLLAGSVTAIPQRSRKSFKELRNYMDDLVDQRKDEILQGISNTETRTTIRDMKPYTDQLLFISRIAYDLKKTTAKIHFE